MPYVPHILVTGHGQAFFNGKDGEMRPRSSGWLLQRIAFLFSLRSCTLVRSTAAYRVVDIATA